MGWLGWTIGLHAHGDAHDLIKVVTEEIRQQPRNPELYFRRAELHRRHGELDDAMVDYELSARFSNTNRPMLDLARGMVFLEAKWPRMAKLYLDRVLSVETNHIVALSGRAKASLQLDDRDGAVRDYTTAIQASKEPRPELYLDRAQALVTEDGSRLKEALAGLDEGIQRLGNVVTLQLYAIDLELKRKQTNAALDRLDKVAAQSPRKEPWLARRGEILQQAGRWAEAKDSFQSALEQIRTLPPARRNLPALQELEKRIQQSIEALKAKLAP